MVESVCGTMQRIALRNYVLHLPVPRFNVNLAISAQPVLSFHQYLDKFQVGRSSLTTSEPLPIFDLVAFVYKKSCETLRAVVQRLDTLHSGLPTDFMIRRRLISISALSSAESRGDSSSSSRRKVTASSESPWSSLTRRV